jgi:hypothetical protein
MIMVNVIRDKIPILSNLNQLGPRDTPLMCPLMYQKELRWEMRRESSLSLQAFSPQILLSITFKVNLKRQSKSLNSIWVSKSEAEEIKISISQALVNMRQMLHLSTIKMLLTLLEPVSALI